MVRGSKTSTDWKINLNDAHEDFVYRSGPRGEAAVAVAAHRGERVGEIGVGGDMHAVVIEACMQCVCNSIWWYVVCGM